MKRHRKDLQAISEINLTNLLDTTFVLLVALLLVAPQMKSGFQLELPQAEGVSQLETDDTKMITIQVLPRDPETTTDRILVNGARKSLEDVGELMRQAHEAQPDISVEVQADVAASAGTLVQLIGSVRNAGIENFAFPAMPLPEAGTEKGQPAKRKGQK